LIIFINGVTPRTHIPLDRRVAKPTRIKAATTVDLSFKRHNLLEHFAQTPSKVFNRKFFLTMGAKLVP
jgi:hypothetical protein